MQLDPFVIDRPYGRVEVTLEVNDEGDQRVCGLRRLAGTINLPPKAFRAAVRAEISTIEKLAKNAGCTEMRHVGRGWNHILDDYEPIPGVPHGLRKRL